MDSLIESIKKNWLKWESTPFVFAIIAMFYVTLASEINDWTGIDIGGMEYLLLSLPFIALFLVYLVCCFVHVKKEKAKALVEAGNEQLDKKQSVKKTIWLITGICAAVLAIFALILVLISNSGHRDGKYIIWSNEYHVALSPKVHNSYYLEGKNVNVRGDKLADYPNECVVELDFMDDEKFTISYKNKKLGVTPGKNGVGYASQNTSVLWQLEEQEDGVYYIRNVDENTYLKWYEYMQNWTSHPNIVDKNEDQYLLCLERVG